MEVKEDIINVVIAVTPERKNKAHCYTENVWTEQQCIEYAKYNQRATFNKDEGELIVITKIIDISKSNPEEVRQYLREKYATN